VTRSKALVTPKLLVHNFRFSRLPSLGWPERLGQAAQPGGFDDHELAAEPGKRTVGAAKSGRAVIPGPTIPADMST
jgi:hypothetical protein